MHAQLPSGVLDLSFFLSLQLLPYFLYRAVKALTDKTAWMFRHIGVSLQWLPAKSHVLIQIAIILFYSNI